MSSASFRHVLAILDGDPEDYSHVIARAVELAEAERARLTLAKTRGPLWLAHGVCVFPLVTVPPAVDLERHARDVLARTAELIPQTVSLSTLLLGDDACLSLRRVLGRGDYDLLVADERYLRRRWRLRRLLQRADISTLAVVRGERDSRTLAPEAAERHPARRA
jgi:hypothetical protein